MLLATLPSVPTFESEEQNCPLCSTDAMSSTLHRHRRKHGPVSEVRKTMSNDNRCAEHSDKEILDLIEDFLVNHFGVDEREHIPRGAAFEMLEHIDDLLELRRGNSQQRGQESSDEQHRVAEADARP